jgi:hypothetical protein
LSRVGAQGAPLLRYGLVCTSLHAAKHSKSRCDAGPARTGERCDLAQLARLAARRKDASTGDGFARLLADEDLLLDLGALTYWSHWITPAGEGKRFDTRFFAVEVPADQEASADLSELTHHAWMTADEVRTRLRSGELSMAPPTQATLGRLAKSCTPRQHRRCSRRADTPRAPNPARS